MITIYALMYNEELVLPYFLKHYRKCFPDCHIVLYDNYSTDKSVEIALSWDNVEVIPYDTGGKLSDKTYLEIKNTCWRNAQTDWVMIVDIDEHCLVHDSDLIDEQNAGSTILQFEGWNMVGMNGLDISKIDHAVKAPSYDKMYCFRRSKIESINYGWGAHTASPSGELHFSTEIYKCLHYKYIDPEYMVTRHAHFASRMSEENIKKGLGSHYRYPANKIRKEFSDARRNAIKIL